MSDLVATNCGNGCGCERSCGCERGCGYERNSGGCSNIIWILLILSFCGGGSGGCGFGGGNWFGGDGDCCSIIWILLLLSCCGGGFGGNGSCGSGCGC